MLPHGKILVVDDEEVMREFLLEVFDSYQPLGARDGEEAYSVVMSQPVSLVITDLKMPRMDGLELLKKVKQHNQEIKVIVVTGYASLDMASACIDAGAFDFLKKPFSINQIRGVVERALGEGHAAKD
jgi:two-component system response regulator PilR (NtrC family)